MRRLLSYEVKAAAAALTKLPLDERERMCDLWLHQADWAHKIMKTTGKPHAVWGNGSLSQAMHIREFPEFDIQDDDHRGALSVVLACLDKRRMVNQTRS